MQFHPTASNVSIIMLFPMPESFFVFIFRFLAASFGTCVQIFDISCETTCFGYATYNVIMCHIIARLVSLDLDGQESVVESISWHGNGHLLSTICKVT